MTELSIDSDRHLRDLVGEAPEFVQVFEANGIDYCCDGTRSLEEACSKEGLEVTDICDQLAAVHERDDGRGNEEGSLSRVVDDIVTTHHHLRDELPVLEGLIQTVNHAHGNDHPELAQIEREFTELAEAIRSHISTAEDDVFPIVDRLDYGGAIAESEAARARDAIDTLKDSHTRTESHLERITDLSEGFAVPEDTCPTYREMLERLAEVERETHLLVHKESNILFPRVENTLRRGEYEVFVPYPTAHNSLLKSLDTDVAPSLQGVPPSN